MKLQNQLVGDADKNSVPNMFKGHIFSYSRVHENLCNPDS